MGIAQAVWRLKKIKILQDYTVDVEFLDGSQGIIEMRGFIFGKKAGVFAVLKDKNLFDQAYLELGVLTWPGEIDLAPDAMYEAIKQQGRWVLPSN